MMTMKEMKKWLMVAAVIAVCGMMSGCKGKSLSAAVQHPVNGTMDEAVIPDDASQAVEDLMKHVTIDDRYETLMEDKATGVSVWSLLKCNDSISSEGHGIVVAKGDVKTALPHMQHGRMPRAHYDAATGELLILGSQAEGTGINIGRVYMLRFDDDGYATITNSIEPYEMQQAWLDALTYSIDGQDITFYIDGEPMTTVTNHIEDMGGFMDDAIYVGEQIDYSIEGPIRVLVTPGVNFVVGKVLHYEDMPTISAAVTMTESGPKLSDFRVEP